MNNWYWFGILIAQFIAWPQLYSLIKHKHNKVSLLTYIALCVSIGCNIYRAVSIHDPYFMLSTFLNFPPNFGILIILLKRSGRFMRRMVLARRWWRRAWYLNRLAVE